MLRAVTVLCLVLATALPTRAGEKERTPVNADRVSLGWLNLLDDASAFGWTVHGQLKKEKSVLQGEHLRLTSTDSAKPARMALNTALPEFELQLHYSTPHTGSATIYLAPAGATEPNAKMDRFVLPGSAKPTSATFRVTAKSFSGKTTTKTDGPVDFPEAKRGNPGQPITIIIESTSLNLHHVGLLPLGTKSIFNGKDLAGWKVFPGDKYKSKFTVTAKGEMNVKDGPGDLQTVGKYKNFVLQFECLSNGKHLNSGIFFRCRPNEYQNGYEAQIRNQFTPEATQKYLVEEYDPKTNKLLAKKEMMSTAFDFGTGAIYRRIPARKGMSRDGEWFGMTIVANGNHLATFVNGVQVADWRDHRPMSDNARTGCKLEAGHISIQGHDPTTDLSFRNFRIAEFPGNP